MDQSSGASHPTTNPFIFGRPLIYKDPFFGRNDELSWLRKTVHESDSRQPLVLLGSTGIGKSSFLNRLIYDDPQIQTTVYLDTPKSIKADIRDFLWGFSQRISIDLAEKGWSPPPLQKRMLVLRPQEEFKKRFWLPLSEMLGGKRLLIAWDDADMLFRYPEMGFNNSALLDIMLQLNEEVEAVCFLFALDESIEREILFAEIFKGQERALKLERFDRMTSLDIMNQVYPRRLATIVANHIYNLTGGYPNDLQRLCHALYDRCLRLGTNHITTADVAVTLSIELNPGDFYMPVYKRRNIYKYRSRR